MENSEVVKIILPIIAIIISIFALCFTIFYSERNEKSRLLILFIEQVNKLNDLIGEQEIKQKSEENDIALDYSLTKTISKIEFLGKSFSSFLSEKKQKIINTKIDIFRKYYMRNGKFMSNKIGEIPTRLNTIIRAIINIYLNSNLCYCMGCSFHKKQRNIKMRTRFFLNKIRGKIANLHILIDKRMNQQECSPNPNSKQKD